jgi:pimeloyl-ACP methyl ester carboxylesterase
MWLAWCALLAVDAYAPMGAWRIHYTTAGAGDSTFVLVHGWNGSAAQWDPVAERLSARARVIAVDLPGHGQSGAPRVDYTMTLLASAVGAVLEHAAVERAVLVGHSLSVAVVREVEHRFPGRVGSLVLVDGTYWDGTTEAGIRRAELANETYARALANPGTYRGVALRTVETMFTAATPMTLRRLLRTTMLETPAHVAGSTMIELARSRVWTFGASRVPVVSVMADTAGNRGYAPFLRRMFPLLRASEYWAGAGHFLHLEQPGRFVALLLGLR